MEKVVAESLDMILIQLKEEECTKNLKIFYEAVFNKYLKFNVQEEYLENFASILKDYIYVSGDVQRELLRNSSDYAWNYFGPKKGFGVFRNDDEHEVKKYYILYDKNFSHAFEEAYYD